MEKIKVIEYISNLGDGGAETLVREYVRLIDRNRFDPIVVIMRGDGTSANRRIVEEERVPIIEIFPRWNILVRIWKKLFGRWYIPYRLRQIILKENASVLHMHLMVLKHVPYLGKMLDDLRLLFTCHNVPEKVFEGERVTEKDAARKLIKEQGMQLIALHDEMADELNKMFDVQNTAVIRNGIDFKRFRSVPISSAEKRMELGIPQDAYVVGHVGRFAEQKNHPFLVETFIEVAKQRSDAYLLMVGAGDTSAVEQRLKESDLGDRYKILSHRSDVNEIMRTMDVFVFPSLYEGLGIVLIEAQVAGLRCIVSEAIPQEACMLKTVVSLPLGNPKEWADTILDETIIGEAHGNIDDYDMNKEIKHLEELYLGQW